MYFFDRAGSYGGDLDTKFAKPWNGLLGHSGDETSVAEGTGLAHWLVPLSSSGAEHISAFAAHPRFPAAARRLAHNLLTFADQNRAFDGIAKDAGRFALSFAAIYLDSTGGITIPRLKELCELFGVASPGRARAILFYLLFLGFAAPDGKEGRVSRYAATDRLREVWKLYLQARLDAASLVEPLALNIAANLNDPSYFAAFVRVQGSGISYLASELDRRSALQMSFQSAILDRNAGMQLLHYLALQLQGDDDYPPAGAIALSVRDAARRLRVSRQHLLRLLRHAEAAGLLVRGKNGAVQFMPSLREETRRQVAIALTLELFVAARLEAEQNSRS